MRRWRGFKDIPLSLTGKVRAKLTGVRLSGELDIIYHDGLVRCRETARIINSVNIFDMPIIKTEGPRPWRMGQLFEGREINEDSIGMARWYIDGNPDGVPPGGEPFKMWSGRWEGWIRSLKYGASVPAVITHNRNIQYLYAIQSGEFEYSKYDCDGPDFCSVHVYHQQSGLIVPWDHKTLPHGFIYLIRHGDTEWGT